MHAQYQPSHCLAPSQRCPSQDAPAPPSCCRAACSDWMACSSAWQYFGQVDTGVAHVAGKKARVGIRRQWRAGRERAGESRLFAPAQGPRSGAQAPFIPG